MAWRRAREGWREEAKVCTKLEVMRRLMDCRCEARCVEVDCKRQRRMLMKLRGGTAELRNVHGCPYTFSVKPKWRTVVLWFFAARSSAEAYLRTSTPRGHSTVGVPSAVKVSWRFGCVHARSSRTTVQFKLLVIYSVCLFVRGKCQNYGTD